MRYRVRGLSAEPFQHLFGLTDEELARHGAERHVADGRPAFPDRIELCDARRGELVLLVNYTHQPASNAFQSSHAIFVLEGAAEPYDGVDALPDALAVRLLSLRAFDQRDMMIDADIAEGADAEPLIERLLANPDTAYIHAHYARRGCFAARIDRA